jgi:murein DD-endopeptidase MepM/ murein hydrolase activator NlpD
VNFSLKAPLAMMFATEGFAHTRAGRDYHGGVDLRAPVGTPVSAAASGTVRFVGTYSDTPGTAIELVHDDGMLTRYLHLSQANVKAGQRVSAGQALGRTGFATSPHLHADAWVPPSKLGEYVSKFGTPTTGFTVTQGFGNTKYVKVPFEPLAPMSYQQDVIDSAKKHNVKLYSPLRDTRLLLAVLLLAGGGYAAYRYFKASPSSPSLPA